MVVRDILLLLKKGGEDKFRVHCKSGQFKFSNMSVDELSVYDSRLSIIANKQVQELSVEKGMLKVTI